MSSREGVSGKTLRKVVTVRCRFGVSYVELFFHGVSLDLACGVCDKPRGLSLSLSLSLSLGLCFLLMCCYKPSRV